MFTYNEAFQSSLEYFSNDNLAAKVVVDKYLLRDDKGNFLEKSPEDMHWRIAREFARIEKNKFKNPLSEKEIFDLLDKFKYIVPQGSPMYGIGNNYTVQSLGNCFTLGEHPYDSYGGICYADQMLVQLSKRRAGVGICLDNIRPKGLPTKNAAKTTDGIAVFMERFSNSIREVAQCLYKDTIILTSEGLKKISNVEVGDSVWTENGWEIVNKVLKNTKPTIKITTSYGKELICSPDHIIHCLDKELKAKELQVGDIVTTIVGQEWYGNDIPLVKNNIEKIGRNQSNRLTKDLIFPEILDTKLAYILGYSYGDGCLESKNQTKSCLSLACNPKDTIIIQKLVDYIKETFNYTCKNYQLTQTNGCCNVNIFPIEIIQYLQDNNFLKQKSENIVFPEQLLTTKPDIVFAFISGYFDADGSVTISKKRYKFDSINKQFLQNIQNIFQSFGIVARLSEQDRTKEGWQTIYHLTISGQKSQERLRELMKESVKVENKTFSPKKMDWLKTIYTVNNFGTRCHKHSYIMSNKQYISYSTCERLSQDLELENNYILIQDKINKITKYEEESEVYDLCLDNTHLFFANGFYVHNSGRRGASLQGLSIHHPEIETFINIKRDKTKVTGANISVLLTDEFMEAVKSNSDYEQRWPIDSDTPLISKMVSAKKIWDQIIDAAWTSAEPGLLFIDNARKYGLAHQYSVKDNRFADIITNPCVTGDTKILCKSKNGKVINKRIDKLVGQNVEIWNGYEWSEVVIEITGYNQPILKIKTDQGHHLKCTYGHSFILEDNTRVRAEHLKIGDKLLNPPKSPQTYCLYSGTVTSISNSGYASEVYCFSEPKRSCGIFNNILTGQCGELWIGLDSCRLMLLNLFSYIDHPFESNAKFNFEKFSKHVIIAQRLMDDMVDLEIEKMEQILSKIESDPEPDFVKQVEKDMWTNYLETAKLGRRTGLGITALGDALAALNIKYGSDESIKETEKIYKALAINSMKSSCLMAKELGAFPIYDSEIENDSEFLNRILNADKEVKTLHDKFGRRNISLTTTSPAGTVSLLTQTTSGIEPAFLLEYTRRRKLPPDTDKVPDFIDQSGDKWENNLVRHHHLQTWMNISNKTKIEESPYFQATSNDIDWEKSVDIQAAAQKWTSHSLSKTCNIPNNSSKELVANIYINAYEKKLKGFTIYRDGCRDGVLFANEPKTQESKIPKHSAPKRPKELPCDLHHLTVDGKKFWVAVGLFQNEPYELFAARNNKAISQSVTKGKVTKLDRPKCYKGIFDDGTELSPLTAAATEEEETITRLVSLSLRHGADVKFITEQLQKIEGDMNSFARGISRVLKKYVPDGTESKEKCKDCGGTLIYNSGCSQCSSCASSKCN